MRTPEHNHVYCRKVFASISDSRQNYGPTADRSRFQVNEEPTPYGHLAARLWSQPRQGFPCSHTDAGSFRSRSCEKARSSVIKTPEKLHCEFRDLLGKLLARDANGNQPLCRKFGRALYRGSGAWPRSGQNAFESCTLLELEEVLLRRERQVAVAEGTLSCRRAERSSAHCVSVVEVPGHRACPKRRRR
jgi:hypothetical protein